MPIVYCTVATSIPRGASDRLCLLERGREQKNEKKSKRTRKSKRAKKKAKERARKRKNEQKSERSEIARITQVYFLYVFHLYITQYLIIERQYRLFSLNLNI